ncbi:hypothetical protein HPG69_014439 [Diceros bicornis minor]|uniref:Ensconsin n=1 Tax=Diceros bicornis minor TaxID=77932 RepID=A0A7J7EWJ1_DICBM|nr:hypothetical protein HPG69_014439 [Diceros bicornis minor]
MGLPSRGVSPDGEQQHLPHGPDSVDQLEEGGRRGAGIKSFLAEFKMCSVDSCPPSASEGVCNVNQAAAFRGRKQLTPDSYKVQEKTTAAPNRPPTAVSGQNSSHSGPKPDPPPVLRVDDRQRLARERREEREKQLAAREIVWLEREERARQHYERHLEERKKKLEEQRLKEERRRAAVEEKRRQRLEEDKERHEAVVRRTMERSRKPRQKHNRWSWGGPLHGSPRAHSAGKQTVTAFRSRFFPGQCKWLLFSKSVFAKQKSC